jgi:phage repressor protein C with HTH and peptisase S24 domain
LLGFREQADNQEKMAAHPVTTELGQYVVIEVAIPGAAAQNAGVLLVDPTTKKGYLRVRRDLSELSEEDADVLEALADDLAVKSEEMSGGELLSWLQENASNFVRVTDREEVMVDRFDRTLQRLYSRHVNPKILPFRTHLPVYGAQAAAGKWGPAMEVDGEPEYWTEAPQGLRLTEDMFVARVTGRSMEPRIPANSLCIFRAGSALVGSRQGKLVLVMNYGEPGENRFTIKRYTSIKRRTEEGWQHESIRLQPLNPEYDAWTLDEDARLEVIGEFVTVLETQD